MDYINPSASVPVTNGIILGFRRADAFPSRGASIRLLQDGTADGSGDATTAISFWTYALGVDNGAERVKITEKGIKVVGLPVYANNAAAAAGGLVAGEFYRTNGDPDTVCVVH